MADENKDVLSRADSLMRRPGSGVDTGGVPVLTDLIPELPEADAELAREITRQVTAAMEARLGAEIERMRSEMAAAIEAAVARALATRQSK